MSEQQPTRNSLGRRPSLFLLGVAAWNFVTWATFAKNLSAAHASGEDRPAGYWIAHSVLIVVNMVIGIALAGIGLRSLKAKSRD